MRTLQLLVPLLALLALSTVARAQVPSGSILRLSADSELVSSGGEVVRWTDISGNGNDATQSDSTRRPQEIIGGSAGRAVRFGGTAYLNTPSVFPTASDYTLAFVVRVNSYTTANNVVSGNLYAHYFGSAPLLNVLHAGDFSKQATSRVSINTGWNVVVVRYVEATRSASINVNGIDAGTAEIPANNDPAIYIGAFQAGNYLTGDIAQIALWNRSLSAIETASLQNTGIARYGIATPQPFTSPAANPWLWLTADTGVGTVNGHVAEWLDHSGNHHRFTQSDTALQPALQSYATFNLSAVHFSGSSFMAGPTIFPTASDYSLSFVVRLNNMAATNNVISGTTHAHWFGGAEYARVLHGDFNRQAIASLPVTQSEFAIVTVLYNESTTRASIYINSHFADSAAVGSNLDSTLYLGAFQGGNLLVGDIAEVVLYKRELTSTERATTENYLFRKYGIAVPPPPPQPDSTFTSLPSQLQLYPRDTDDSARVPVAGRVHTTGWDSISVEVEQDGVMWKRYAARLHYTGGAAPFALTATLHAERSEYRFRVQLHRPGIDSTLAIRDSILCGDALLICGQSNSIYGGSAASSEWCRTYGRNYSQNARDTLWTVASAAGYGGGPDIGAWGMRMAQLYTERARVPVAVINGGVGGTAIELHQRNDAAPFTLSTIYGSMLYRVVKAGLASKARTMLWYQGESNTITDYARNFRALYEDWRSDYPALEKVYVVQIRPGCAAGPHSELRELLRTLRDSLPDIVPYSPMGVPGHDGCHYAVPGYDTIGTQLFRLVDRDLLGSTDTLDIGSPDIRRAFYSTRTGDEIALVFSNARSGLLLTPDTTVSGVNATIAGAFLLNDSLQEVRDVRIAGDTLYLHLNRPMVGGTISYIPDQNYPGTAVVYEGPWVKNGRGVGAFSFYRIPIDPLDTATGGVAGQEMRNHATVAPNPTSGSAALLLTLSQPEQVNVEIIDPAGHRHAHFTSNAAAGSTSISLPTEHLTAGVYYCRVTTDRWSEIVEIKVMR